MITYIQKKEQQVKMQCEYRDCANEGGKDYLRKVWKHDGWDEEPIYLCDKHAERFKKQLKPITK